MKCKECQKKAVCEKEGVSWLPNEKKFCDQCDSKGEYFKKPCSCDSCHKPPTTEEREDYDYNYWKRYGRTLLELMQQMYSDAPKPIEERKTKKCGHEKGKYCLCKDSTIRPTEERVEPFAPEPLPPVKLSPEEIEQRRKAWHDFAEACKPTEERAGECECETVCGGCGACKHRGPRWFCFCDHSRFDYKPTPTQEGKGECLHVYSDAKPINGIAPLVEYGRCVACGERKPDTYTRAEIDVLLRNFELNVDALRARVTREKNEDNEFRKALLDALLHWGDWLPKTREMLEGVRSRFLL